MNEKRRRRRESHNAVERRRRDNINEKINELSTLIPECLLVEAGAGPNGAANGLSSEFGTDMNGDVLAVGGGLDEDAGGASSAALKANKGIILRKSVDYIR